MAGRLTQPRYSGNVRGMETTTTHSKASAQHRKAVAITATFRALDLDQWEPGRLSDTGWKLAARAAWLALPADQRPATQWTDASLTVRQMVADMLQTDPATEAAVFASIAAGTSATIRSTAN